MEIAESPAMSLVCWYEQESHQCHYRRPKEEATDWVTTLPPGTQRRQHDQSRNGPYPHLRDSDEPCEQHAGIGKREHVNKVLNAVRVCRVGAGSTRGNMS